MHFSQAPKLKFAATIAIGVLIAADACVSREALAAEPVTPQPAAALEKFFGPQSDWPRHRGPAGDSISQEKGLPTKWSKTENVLWSVDLFQPRASYPFHPYASPIVYKDKIFVVLAKFKDDIFVAPPKDLKLKEPKPAGFKENMDCRLVCFNKSDGKKLWDAPLEPGPNTEIEAWKPGAHEDQNSPTASTPCTDGERVYVAISGSWGNGGMLAAVDYAGKVVWRQDLSVKLLKSGFPWTIGTSPFIYKDFVIMYCALNTTSIVAFDRKSGEMKYCESWPNAGGYAAGYGTPIPALLKGTPFLLGNTKYQIQGINPENGKLVWFANQRSGGGSLAVGGGIVYGDVAQGAKPVKVEGAALALDSLADAKGDITASVKWKTKDLCRPFASEDNMGELSSPVIYGGYVYRGVNQYVVCIEAASGNVMYMEKLPGLNGAANPFATADGLIYFVSAAKSYVIKSGPKFELIAANDLDDKNFLGYGIYGFNSSGSGGGFVFNSAAVSGGKIIIQGQEKLWCIGK